MTEAAATFAHQISAAATQLQQLKIDAQRATSAYNKMVKLNDSLETMIKEADQTLSVTKSHTATLQRKLDATTRNQNDLTVRLVEMDCELCDVEAQYDQLAEKQDEWARNDTKTLINLMDEIRGLSISQDVVPDEAEQSVRAFDALQPVLDAETELTRQAAELAAQAKAQADSKLAEVNKLYDQCRTEFTSSQSKFTAEQRKGLMERINRYCQLRSEGQMSLKDLVELGRKKWAEFASFPHRHAPRTDDSEMKEEKEESKTTSGQDVPECNGSCPADTDTEVQVQCTRCGVWIALDQLIDQPIYSAHESAPLTSKMFHQFVTREFGSAAGNA